MDSGRRDTLLKTYRNNVKLIHKSLVTGSRSSPHDGTGPGRHPGGNGCGITPPSAMEERLRTAAPGGTAAFGARGVSDGGARPITTRRQATFRIGRVADRFIPRSCGYLGVYPFVDRSDYPEIKCLPGLAKIACNHFFVLRYHNCSERYLNV